MRLFRLIICLLLFFINGAYALPNCPSSQPEHWDNCRGTYVWGNGDQYLGGFKDSLFHGQGTFISANGEKYVGELEYNFRHGVGVQTSLNGDLYEGEFFLGKSSGKGTYTWANGTSYVGEWRNGEQNGFGIKSTPNGATYVGYWKSNQAHGEGSLTKANGSKFEGLWSNGQFVRTKSFTKIPKSPIPSVFQTNCHMSTCWWLKINKIRTNYVGQSFINPYLIEIEAQHATSGHSCFKGNASEFCKKNAHLNYDEYDHSEDYPVTFEDLTHKYYPESEFKWSEPFTFKVFCSRTRPSVIWRETDVETLNVTVSSGHLLSTQNIYFHFCHNGSEEDRANLGYKFSPDFRGDSYKNLYQLMNVDNGE